MILGQDAIARLGTRIPAPTLLIVAVQRKSGIRRPATMNSVAELFFLAA